MSEVSQSDIGADLMLRWQVGDEAAFERLVELFSPRVYVLLTRFLGQDSSREDLVQEVFLRLVKARDRYTPTARFTTWLYRIVFNLSVTVSEKKRATTVHSLDQGLRRDGESQAFDVADEDGEGPEEAMARGDTVAAVRAAIAALPDNQRMALVLAKYDELPYVEISEVLEVSEQAVKSLVHRARETLREKLAPLLAEDML